MYRVMAHLTTESVAAEIRAEMARKRLTIDALAERLKMPRSSVNRRIQGEQLLTVEDITALAAALDVPTSQFLAPPTAAAS